MWWGAVNSGLVWDVWCAWGAEAGDEAMAGGGGVMGKGAASECGGWDGGVQDTRSASYANVYVMSRFTTFCQIPWD